MKAKVGSLLVQTTDTVGTTIAVTGLGFQPKTIIFFYCGRDEAVDTLARDDAFPGISYVDSATERVMAMGKAEDAVGTSDTARYQRDDSIAGMIDLADASDGLLDLDSLDADGFTVIVDEVFGRDLRVTYLALGGDDLTDDFVSDFLGNDLVGDQSISGVGFLPQIMMCIGVATGSALPSGPNGNLQLNIGGMISDTQQGIVGFSSRNAQATTNTHRYLREGDESHATVSGGGTVNARGRHQSMDADGFTIEWIEPDNDRILYMCMAGGDYAIGGLQTRTDGADIVVTGLGFKPAAVLFVSHLTTESAVDISQDDAQFSIGAATSPDEQMAHHFVDEDAQGTSVVRTGIEHDSVYLRSSSGPTIDGTMKLKRMDADGFTCFMDNPDPSAADVVFFAFGPAEFEGKNRVSQLFGRGLLGKTPRS